VYRRSGSDWSTKLVGQKARKGIRVGQLSGLCEEEDEFQTCLLKSNHPDESRCSGLSVEWGARDDVWGGVAVMCDGGCVRFGQIDVEGIYL
jgi:hypothetical protein